MATLTPTLTLTSTDAMSDAISISVTDSLSVTDPSESSRITVSHSSPTELAAASTGAYYVYIKNVGTNSRTVDVRTAGGTALAQLAVEEFCFIPVKLDVGIEVQSNTGSEIVDYAIFKKS